MDVPWDEQTCSGAAHYGHVGCLKTRTKTDVLGRRLVICQKKVTSVFEICTKTGVIGMHGLVCGLQEVISSV